MRIALILMAMVVVLGCCRQAEAMDEIDVGDDYTFWRGMERFGFHDGTSTKSDGSIIRWSYVNVGPLGSYLVPFTAKQGLIGFCLIVLTLIGLLLAFAVRRKRRART